MQTKSSGYLTLTFLINFCQLIVQPVFAQTTDSLAADTLVRTASIAATMYPLKKLVSDVAVALAQQQQYATLSFDSSRTVRRRIEKLAPFYSLPGGESRAELFRLPEYEYQYTLLVRSTLRVHRSAVYVFAPVVVFLDSLYRPTRLLTERKFVPLSSHGMVAMMSMGTQIRIDSEQIADKYLLIFTMKNGVRVGTFADGMRYLPVIGAPDGKLELELHRN